MGIFLSPRAYIPGGDSWTPRFVRCFANRLNSKEEASNFSKLQSLGGSLGLEFFQVPAPIKRERDRNFSMSQEYEEI